MQQSTSPEPIAVSIDEATRISGEGRTRLFELIDTGELASYKSGRRRLILVRSIRERAERLAQLQKAA